MLVPALLARQAVAGYDDCCLPQGQENAEDDGGGHVHGGVSHKVEEAEEGIVCKDKDEATDENISCTDKNSHDASNNERRDHIGEELDTNYEATLGNADPLGESFHGEEGVDDGRGNTREEEGKAQDDGVHPVHDQKV